ncbi:MAG: hypothetical protein J0H19_22025 [Rhodospirillales bacterium]|nr:hypothetical protein [Rhodospirillales bacterium]
MTATSKGRLHREILEMATVQRRLGIIDESSYREIALRQIRTRDRPTSGLMTGDEVAMPQDASEPRRHQATSKHEHAVHCPTERDEIEPAGHRSRS